MAGALTVTELSKRYGDVLALRPSSFALEAGQITILLGPNGSGKTTLLSCLSGLIRPSDGSVAVEGFDLYRDEVEVRKRLAYVPDVPRFYLELTAYEHLRFVAMANRAMQDFERRVKDLLNRLDLWDARDLFPHNYSRGMRLKLGLALAFIRPFNVLLLDEPTSALDAGGTEVLVNELRHLRDRGVAILLSTHDAGLSEMIGDRRMMIQHGAIAEV